MKRSYRGFVKVMLTLCVAPPLSADDRGLVASERNLQRPVTLQISRASMTQVLAEIAEQADLKLRAHRDVADEPALVFVKERPAAEVLHGLAAVFDYRWRRVREGESDYLQLYQDRDSREREEELFRELRERQVEGLIRSAARRDSSPAGQAPVVLPDGVPPPIIPVPAPGHLQSHPCVLPIPAPTPPNCSRISPF
jgi:hypothetical protein